MWGRYYGKMVKVAILFLITTGRLRAVTDKIQQIQRDTLPRWPVLSFRRLLSPGQSWQKGNVEVHSLASYFKPPFTMLNPNNVLVAAAQ